MVVVASWCVQNDFWEVSPIGCGNCVSLVLVALSVVCARRASFVRSDLRRSPLIRIRGLSPLCADTPHIARSVAGRPGPDLGRRRKASTTVCLAGPAPGHRTYPSGGVRRTTGTWLFVLAGIVCFFCFRQEGFAATPELFFSPERVCGNRKTPSHARKPL